MIWYLLKKLLIVLLNTWTFLSLFLANSLFGIAALKKKRAKHTPRVSQASGNPRRYLKRGRAFRLAAFQRNFASTRSTKVYAFRFVQENLFIFFFRKRRDASKYSFDSRITLQIGEDEFDAERRQDFPQILNYHACNICSWKKKCCTVRFFGAKSIMNLSKILDQDSVIVSFRYEWRIDQ